MKFIGDNKTLYLHHSSSIFLRAVVESNNQRIRILIDGIEQVWPNHHINRFLQE